VRLSPKDRKSWPLFECDPSGHYSTSTISNPCAFVRAISLACAQLPRNTTVTRPCVLAARRIVVAADLLAGRDGERIE
jgi:hypothetical protein